jgi:hypothetical protein
LAGLLGLAFWLSACTTTDYIPPPTDDGRQCIASCEAATQACQATEQQANATQKALCESKQSGHLVGCLSSAKTDEARKECRKSAPFCNWMPTAVSNCHGSYNRCFLGCGGKILERPL